MKKFKSFIKEEDLKDFEEDVLADKKEETSTKETDKKEENKTYELHSTLKMISGSRRMFCF